MKIVILPGFSPANATWAAQCAKNFDAHEDVITAYYKHWQTGTPSDFSAYSEAASLSDNLIQCDEFSLVAKSIGTLVAMHILEFNSHIASHIILNGIPLNDLHSEDLKFYEVLSSLPSYKIKIFENSEDPHGNYEKVREFIHNINPSIEIIKKDRSDHDYPYYDEFKKILLLGKTSRDN